MNRGSISTVMVALSGLAAGVAGMLVVGPRIGLEIPLASQVTTHGEWVKFVNSSGDSIRAYVAYPERKDKAPAVIVIHEIFGLTEWEPECGRQAGRRRDTWRCCPTCSPPAGA